MKSTDLLRYLFLPIYRPVRHTRTLFQERHMLGYSLIIYLFLGIIYTGTVQIAYMRGFGTVAWP